MTERPPFRETQRFTRWWAWRFVVAGLVAVGAATGWALFREAAEGPGAAVGIAVGVYALLAALLWLFLAGNLVTEVEADGVYFRYFPFHRARQRIGLEQIDQWEARRYNPLLDYGGWGIRIGLRARGKAYNMYGRWGVWFRTGDGRQCLLGTQQPEAFAAALRAALDARQA